MKGFPKSMSELIKEFGKLPGVGPKSAQRLAFFLLKSDERFAKELSEAIINVKKNVKSCKICNNLSDAEICEICQNVSRDKAVICVVERPGNVISIEKMGQYHGLYHVLLGALSPIDGIGPKDIKLHDLFQRVKKEKIKEVIIATDSNTEGEATALYTVKLLKSLPVKVTRIASGIPVGANLEYADQATLQKAFRGRIKA